jgi:hypothetical protein
MSVPTLTGRRTDPARHCKRGRADGAAGIQDLVDFADVRGQGAGEAGAIEKVRARQGRTTIICWIWRRPRLRRRRCWPGGYSQPFSRRTDDWTSQALETTCAQIAIQRGRACSPGGRSLCHHASRCARPITPSADAGVDRWRAPIRRPEKAAWTNGGVWFLD